MEENFKTNGKRMSKEEYKKEIIDMINFDDIDIAISSDMINSIEESYKLRWFYLLMKEKTRDE